MCLLMKELQSIVRFGDWCATRDLPKAEKIFETRRVKDFHQQQGARRWTLSGLPTEFYSAASLSTGVPRP
jgi:hypothetical protein